MLKITACWPAHVDKNFFKNTQILIQTLLEQKCCPCFIDWAPFSRLAESMVRGSLLLPRVQTLLIAHWDHQVSRVAVWQNAITSKQKEKRKRVMGSMGVHQPPLSLYDMSFTFRWLGQKRRIWEGRQPQPSMYGFAKQPGQLCGNASSSADKDLFFPQTAAN